MSETIVVPDNGNGNGWNSPLGLLALGGGNGWGNGWGNGGFLGGGFGAGLLGGVLGGIFTNWIGGNGWGMNGGWGNGNAAAASLGAQATANNNTDLLMNAITNQGERQHEAVQTLSTMLGQDFNLVNSGIQTMQTALATIAANQGMNTMQVINSIQSGNSSLAMQLCQCCNTMQTAVLNGIAGVNQNIDATRAAQQLSDCQQTYTLSENNNRNTQSILAKLDAMSTQALQDKLDSERAKNTQLSSELSQYQQNQYMAGVVGQAIAPINAQLAALAKEVDGIQCKMPSTIPVTYPNVQAISTTPNFGGFWGNGFFGNGFGNNVVF